MSYQRVEEAGGAGLDAEGLHRLRNAIEQDIARGTYDGAVFIVARHGTVAMHEAIGRTDTANDRAADTGDVFHLMSITKQFTTLAVLATIDRGDLSLTTRVSEIIPEFGTRGKQNITVAHLLTHMSGLNTELPMMTMPDEFLNIDKLVAKVCDERLFRRPGRVVSYNTMTAHAVLAALVCRLDDARRPFGQILTEDLFAPLGMVDTSFSLRADLAERRVPIRCRYGTEGLFDPAMLEMMNDMYTVESEFPAGGAIGTASDLFRFTEMLRRGGALDGARVVSPGLLELALTNQTGSLPNDIFDYAREMRGWPDWPAWIGLTFFLRGEGVFPTPLGVATSPRTFSGQGAGSTLFWVDPERDLTFVCLTAGLLEDSDNLLRFQRLSDLVVAASVDER